MSQTHVVIVGHGVAGLSAAHAARAQDAGCRITIIGDEPHDAYYRPRLSHDLATGIQVDKIRLRPPGFYTQQRIEVRHGAVVDALDAERRVVRLAGGDEIEFAACVIATGSRSFMPPIKGGDRPGVYTLRSAADAQAIRERALATKVAAVAGGGLLGLEAAHGLAGLVESVVVLERGNSLLSRQLDEPGAALLAELLGRTGIKVMTKAEVAAAVGEGPDDTGSLAMLELKDGSAFDCGLLVVAAGVRPRTELAAAAGIEVGSRGVTVDDHMATSLAGIFACGDVAAHPSGNFGIWPQAMAQGRVAGANAAGGKMTYVPVVPQNLLTVAGTSVFAVGEAGVLDPAAAAEVQEIASIDPVAGRYAKFRVRGQALAGAMLLGDGNLAKLAKPAVEARLPVGPVMALPEAARFDALVSLIGG